MLLAKAFALLTVVGKPDAKKSLTGQPARVANVKVSGNQS